MKRLLKLLPEKKSSYLLLAAFILECLLSAKWPVSLAAWIVPVVWVFLARNMSLPKFVAYAFLVRYIASVIGAYGVFPFPIAIIFIYMIFTTALSIIPYLIDRITASKIPPFLQSLLLPASFVLIEFFMSNSPAGTWGSMAYTQENNPAIIQFSALAGIWGILFFIYWTGPIVNNLLLNQTRRGGFLIYCVLLALVWAWGFTRFHFRETSSEDTITIGSVTANQLSVAEALYEDINNRSITIPPRIAQSDPLLAEINLGFIEYMKEPESNRFEQLRQAQHDIRTNLFRKSAKLAENGAQIIVWSEAAVQTIKPNENDLIKQGAEFAEQHQVWLILPAAVFHPGQHDPGEPFLENKLIFFDPSGNKVLEYFKNVPVKGLEPSYGGDGHIPVIEMVNHNVAAVICYDADFPDMISQTGRNNAEILLVPSSDWYAIGNAHASMAKYRAIENGVSMFRPAGNGRTTVTDAMGRIVLNSDYYFDHEHSSLVSVPIISTRTLYSQYPRLMIYLSSIILLTGTGWRIIRWRT